MATNIRTAVMLALRAPLEIVVGATPIAFASVPYVPIAGTQHVRESLIYGPGATEPSSLGPPGTAFQRTRGIYQPTIRTPLQRANSGTPSRNADLLADMICDEYKPGRELFYDGRRVVIESCSAGTTLTQPPDWSDLPVSIAFWSDFQSFT